MEKKVLDIRIEVFEIKVEKDFFSFKFDWYKDGKRHKGFYDSDYDSWTISEWRNELQKGEALRLALQKIVEEY